MARFVSLAAVCMLIVTVASGGELAGVTMADRVTVGDVSVELNGMGLRKKLWVEVYVAGLYVASPSSDPAEIVGSTGPKRMVMHFLTDRATKKKMDEAWLEGFEANSPQVWPKIEDRVTKFVAFFGDMKEGDVVEIDIVPGAGTSVAVNGDPMGVIEGDDFGSALLEVWLGDHPPSDDLKAGLLGR